MEDDNASPVRVPDAELEFSEELMYRRNGTLFTGIAFDEGPTGMLSEVSYRAGLQDGVSRDWWPSGRLKGETYFRENVQHGPMRQYSEEGAMVVDSRYEYGILVELTRKNGDGEVVESYRIDPEAATYPVLERWRREKGWST